MKAVVKCGSTSMLYHVYVQGKEYISGYDNEGVRIDHNPLPFLTQYNVITTKKNTPS